MSRIEIPREAIKDGSTGIFCLWITCQYGLLTKLQADNIELTIFKGANPSLATDIAKVVIRYAR